MSSTDGSVLPLKCAVKFKPPTLVLFYKEAPSGKNRRRSMPLRGFTSDTSVPAYARKLLRSPRHTAYVSKIPHSQLESLLQKVKDAQSQANPTPTSLQNIPTLATPTSLQNIPTLAPPKQTTVLDEQFESALAELLGSSEASSSDGKPGDEPDKKREPHTVVEATRTTKAGETEGPLSLRLEATTSPHKLLGRRLPPLEGRAGPSSAGLGSVLTTVAAKSSHPASDMLGATSLESKTRVSEQPPTTAAATLVFNAAHRSEEKLPSTQEISPSNGAQPIAPEVSARANGRTPATQPPASQMEEESGLPVATFPTEVPDYSADFSSENGRQGGPHRGEDASLSLEIEEGLSLSNEDLSLSGDREFNIAGGGRGLSASLSGEDFGTLSGIVTGDNSQAEDDLNRASDEVLAQRKAEMEVLFEAHRLQPGDVGYQYDKEVEFTGPKMESGWDSEDSSDMEF